MGIRILVCEEHALLQAGIRAVFAPESDISIIGETSSAREAATLTARTFPRVVLAGSAVDALEIASSLRLGPGAADQWGPGVIALIAPAEEKRALRALQAGARGVLHRGSSPADLLRAVRTVAAGHAWLNSKGGNVEFPVPGALRELSRLWTVRWRVSRLRRINPRPFGLTEDPERPPLSLGSESASAGPIEEISAAISHSAVRLDRLSLLYGDYFDLARPLVEVTTHWDGRGWFTPRKPSSVPSSTWEQISPAAWELGEAERRDDAITRRDWKALGYPQRIPAEGPFQHGSMEIVVSGSPRPVDVVTYKHYVAFLFEQDEATVTVVSRHPLPAMPHFSPVADLDVFFAGYSQFLEELAGRPDGQRR